MSDRKNSKRPGSGPGFVRNVENLFLGMGAALFGGLSALGGYTLGGNLYREMAPHLGEPAYDAPLFLIMNTAGLIVGGVAGLGTARLLLRTGEDE